MNQGQFEAITSRLDRLIELLEAQTGNEIDRLYGINKVDQSSAPAEPAPAASTKPPAKRSKAT